MTRGNEIEALAAGQPIDLKLRQQDRLEVLRKKFEGGSEGARHVVTLSLRELTSGKEAWRLDLLYKWISGWGACCVGHRQPGLVCGAPCTRSPVDTEGT